MLDRDSRDVAQELQELEWLAEGGDGRDVAQELQELERLAEGGGGHLDAERACMTAASAAEEPSAPRRWWRWSS